MGRNTSEILPIKERTFQAQSETKYLIRMTPLLIITLVSLLPSAINSLPESVSSSCSSQTCKDCLGSCDGCDSCNLCKLCPEGLSICAKCKYCKNGQKVARRVVVGVRKSLCVRNALKTVRNLII